MGYVLGTLGLDVLLVVAIFCASAWPITLPFKPERQKAFWWVWLLFIAHVLEEGLTGFPQAWPALLGLEAWPPAFFYGLNGFWLMVWAWACLAGQSWPRIAGVALWFMVLGCGLNMLAHPLLTLYVGHYFPGLVTGPFLGLFGWRWFASTPKQSGV